MRKTIRIPRVIGVIAAVMLALTGCMQSGIAEKELEPTVAKQQTYSFSSDVKPILDQKCIACHACYDAPCQLKLTSAEGLLRGASDKTVYDGTRLTNADPTRLFVDAHGQAQWREKDFFSVFNDQGGSLDDNLANSVFFKMIELGKTNPLPANSPVPKDIPLGLYRENACRVAKDFDQYARDKPQQGMPLAMPGLSDTEYNTLRQWVFEGSVVDTSPWVPEQSEQEQIDRWESFFNQTPLRNQLVARYLYEHLYPAHLYFEDLESNSFFELVRSTTPPGQPIEIIATLRPMTIRARSCTTACVRSSLLLCTKPTCPTHWVRQKWRVTKSCFSAATGTYKSSRITPGPAPSIHLPYSMIFRPEHAIGLCSTPHIISSAHLFAVLSAQGR